MNPRSPLTLPLALVLVLFVSGCGYFMAGTWEDDLGNWERSFHSTKPKDVTVVPSRYWASPHWTYDSAYFFEIAPNKKLKEQLFTENKLRRITYVVRAKERG